MVGARVKVRVMVVVRGFVVIGGDTVVIRWCCVYGSIAEGEGRGAASGLWLGLG